jgi:hypothetical protein
VRTVLSRPGLVAALILLAAVLLHVPTFGQPLLERHGWRQTQTAYTARIFHETGIDLLHSKVPVHGEPWEAPFEFPAYQAVAAVVIDAGVAEDMAMRLTSFAAFLLAATILYRILLRQTGALGALAGLAIFALSPLAIVWSRTSMIDYPAVAATLGFVWCGLRWRTDGGVRWWLAALALGTLAALIKLPTVLFWCAPFILLGFERDDQWASRHRISGAFGLSLLPIVAGVAWTRFTDDIKAASEATRDLTTAALTAWNFGTVDQRLDPEAWFRALFPAIVLVGLAVVPLALVAAWRGARLTRQRRLLGWALVAGIAPVLVFFNLYVQHDYYAIAVSPSVAIVTAMGVAWAAERHRLALIGVAGEALIVSILVIPYWLGIFSPADPDHILPLAAQIEAQTTTDQRVAILGREESPEILYYAHRWGRMIKDEEWSPDLEARLRHDRYVIYRCPPALSDATTCALLPAGST